MTASVRNRTRGVGVFATSLQDHGRGVSSGRRVLNGRANDCTPCVQNFGDPDTDTVLVDATQ